MRYRPLSLGLILLTGLLPTAGRWLQDGSTRTQEGTEGQEEPRPGSPFTTLREAETARIEREILGPWQLNEIYFPETVMDPTAYRGFAIFAEGFLSMIIQVEEDGAGIFGTEVNWHIQAEIYRYRIDDQVQLQVASLMGFNNMTPDGELLFVGSRKVRQYWVRIEDGVMELSAMDGMRLTFRKVGGGEFPVQAIERLRASGGVPLEPWGR